MTGPTRTAGPADPAGGAEGRAELLRRRHLDLASVGPRWPVDAMAMYAFVALGLPDGMIGTAWPAVRNGFGIPLDGLGIVLLVGTVGAISTSSVSGLVLARLGVRPTIMLAGTIACLGALGAVLSPVFWAFVAAGAAIGLAAGFIDSSLNAAVALSGRNRLLNVLHGCYGIGTALGPLVVTAAILAASWRPAYGFLLAVEVLLVTGWWLAGRRRSRATGPAAADEPAEPSHKGPGPERVTPSSPASDLVPLSGPGPRSRLATVVALGLVVFMLYTGFEVSAGQWAPSFDRTTLHLGAAATGIATFGYWGAMTLVRFGLAAPRRPLPQLAIVRWGCAIGVLGALLVWWRPVDVVALLGLVVIGGGLAGVFPALVALTPSRVGGEIAHHVIGWQIGAASIGGAAISALFGVVFQHYGLQYFGPALVVMAVLTMSVALVLERAARATVR